MTYLTSIGSISSGSASWGTIGGTLSSQTDLTTALNGKAASSHGHAQSDVTNLVTDLAGKAASVHTHAQSDVTGLVSALAGKASASHTHAQSDVTNLVSDLAAKQDTITNGYGLTGTTTKAVSLTTSSAYATATTSISAATYADITGCSLTLAAGTWLILGNVVGSAANLIVQGFVAITDGANAVVSETAFTRPASGTASLNSPVAASVFAIVSPSGSTTYKLRAARGLTTHTSTFTVYDGSGYNTTNHATNNTDKGTVIMAIKIA